ncbi:hypothetical protein BKN38_07330 [Helicobacter sp. CLO-3]|uniref:hypothetical protein n=1 Tax=unclassified Helicobacter TaxID=2593540 RepID=UPI000805A492|nr:MULTISPECIES: hypothetical protein [unclassified Helicobacter]OBV29393.1 hypothetical protein BA723_05565 [Helicobacter sp. CLO-3]OHU82341.1 hypothetical protein BKN38_07330 [Helicobacter sp. CLO-3]
MKNSILAVSLIASIALAQPEANGGNVALDSTQGTQASTAESSAQNPAPATSQAPSATQSSAQSSTKEAIKGAFSGAKVEGFGFARYFSNFGEDGEGYSQQYRLKLDVTSGDINGYSITGGIIFSQGSSTPDTGYTTHGSVQGSRGYVDNGNFSDRFGISVFSANKTFKFSDSDKLSIKLGRLNLKSSLNDKNLDMGTGGSAVFQSGKIAYGLEYYDSFIPDKASYALRRRYPAGGSAETRAVGIGNNLAILSVKTGKVKGKDGKEKDADFGGFGFNVTLANAYEFVDYMAFVEGSYKILDTGLSLKAQVVATGINANPNNLQVGYSTSDTNTKLPLGWAHASDYAQFRGIYNINLAYKIGGFSSKLGYLGSFGDGYGVIFDTKGGIDASGKAWNEYFTATYEGFGILGSGSKSGTDIMLAYLNLAYKFDMGIKIALDTTYVGGNNNFPILSSASDATKVGVTQYNAANGGLLNHSQRFKSVDFVEITPSIAYNFTKNLELSAFAAVFAGDINLTKTRFELKYTF